MGVSRLPNPDSSSPSVNSQTPIAIEISPQKLSELKIDESTYQKVIRPQLLLRSQFKKDFNQAFINFANLLTNTQQTKQFFNILEDITARGIAETNIRKKDDAVYHDSHHAAEIAQDVKLLLQSHYQENNFGLLMANCAVTAAACHDIVQGKSNDDNPVLNEEKSAELFAEYLAEKITLHITTTTEYEADVLDEFKKLLPFFANQLIVPSTFLLRPQFVPLLFYVLELEPLSSYNAPDYLDEAAIAISFCDTNRSLLKNVVEQHVLLDTLARMNTVENMYGSESKILPVINKMFTSLNITTDEDKESLLLRLGASLRMFPELNQFRDTDNKLQPESLEALIKELNIVRKTEVQDLKMSGFKKYFETYLKNIDGEKDFAKALNNDCHHKMLKTKNADNFLNDAIYKDGWHKYIDQLSRLKNFYENLEPKQKESLSSILFILAAKQEGVQLVIDNPSVQALLAKAPKPYDKATPRKAHAFFNKDRSEENVPDLPTIKNKSQPQ